VGKVCKAKGSKGRFVDRGALRTMSIKKFGSMADGKAEGILRFSAPRFRPAGLVTPASLDFQNLILLALEVTYLPAQQQPMATPVVSMAGAKRKSSRTSAGSLKRMRIETSMPSPGELLAGNPTITVIDFLSC
jgi:hypothetical protein